MKELVQKLTDFAIDMGLEPRDVLRILNDAAGRVLHSEDVAEYPHLTGAEIGGPGAFEIHLRRIVRGAVKEDGANRMDVFYALCVVRDGLIDSVSDEGEFIMGAREYWRDRFTVGVHPDEHPELPLCFREAPQ